MYCSSQESRVHDSGIHVVDDFSYPLLCGERNVFFRVRSIYVLFHHQKKVIVHLISKGGEELDAVIEIRVMGCAYHDSTIKELGLCNISDTWCCSYMHVVGIGAAGCNAAQKSILKHVAAESCVLSNKDLGLMGLPVLGVIPTKESADTISVVECQAYVCFTSESICSEILWHIIYSPSSLQYHLLS